MLEISKNLAIPEEEIELHAIRSQGAGGQNVNKVATAIHLRFDVRASSLPEICKERLLALSDQRITDDGVVVIKAQDHRSQLKNREAALERLRELLHSVTVTPKQRKPTRPGAAARRRRLEHKKRRGQVKALRKSPPD